MPDLIAQSMRANQMPANQASSASAVEHSLARWRKALPELAANRFVLLGRKPTTSPTVDQVKPAQGEMATSGVVDFSPRHQLPIPWAVPWDPSISRHHAILFVLPGDRIEVRCDQRSRNPIFFRGSPRARFVIVPGEHFVIGETTFTLARRPVFSPTDSESSSRSVFPVNSDNLEPLTDSHAKPSLGSGDVTELAFPREVLQQRGFRNGTARIELLARLPDLVTGSLTDGELFARVTETLLRATESASGVAMVRAFESSETGERTLEVLHYDTRETEHVAGEVSSGLVIAAITRGESILHLWEPGENAAPEFTASEDVDWAFCVPLRGEACQGLAIYVAGSRSQAAGHFQISDDSNSLIQRIGDDVKFSEVVGSLVSGVRQTNQFQQRHAAMRRFFAPVVLDAIATTGSDDWLTPRQCDLSVMFCDLRGFTRTSQQHSDQLLLLLQQVSAALGVMTKHILDTEGVIGDFHGDAAMGFWGWPLPLPSGVDPKQTAALAAARAAAAIRRDYSIGKTQFRCGIGIASGPAVAGRIGTVDQVKVTAFGPVVNLASRLEGLTKKFGVEILVDEATAKHLASVEGVSDTLRYLGRVGVEGIDESLKVFQIMVPVEGQPKLTDSQREQSLRAWQSFESGDWNTAYEQLHELPAWDRPKDVLLRRILEQHRVAPDNWDGIMRFEK